MRAVTLFILIVTCISCRYRCEFCTPADYRAEMRILVSDISSYAKHKNTNFIIVPQNGIELITNNGLPDGELSYEYIEAMDGHGQEDLHFGYYKDDEATPMEELNYLSAFLNRSLDLGKTILVTDYCDGDLHVNEAFRQCEEAGFILFAADERDLSSIPSLPGKPFRENSDNIHELNQVHNFLYLLNQKNYPLKSDFISAVTSSSYDLLIMDLFGEDGSTYTAQEVEDLKVKANGGSRLILCYLSIGEAEDYRYYWNSDWNDDEPEWLGEENPDWEGNYKVRYWYDEWKNILYGTSSAYLDKIISSGFDGVYLDIIDAFEYWE